MTNEPGDERGIETTSGGRLPVPRRTVLRAVGASSVLGLAAGTAAADEHEGTENGDGNGGSDSGAGANGDGGSMPTLDPLFGYASATPNPCGGDASADCFESFDPGVRPSHEVEMRIGIPGLLFAIAGQGVLSDATTESIGAAVADGTVDRSALNRPDARVTVQTEDGPVSVSVAEIAEMVADTLGFYFGPAGLHARPGEVVLFSAESPDHAVASYHDRHGRQNRVPDGVGPFASPLVPVGGYWLFRFDAPGVYDVYCPPHEPFGMVARVVVSAGDVPEPSIEQTGRPPESHNEVASILGGLDPNLPSSLAALETDALSPANVVEEGTVPWADVVAEYRSSA